MRRYPWRVSYGARLLGGIIVFIPDPHQRDADPDPACHFDADPDPSVPFTWMWFRIRILASK